MLIHNFIENSSNYSLTEETFCNYQKTETNNQAKNSKSSWRFSSRNYALVTGQLTHSKTVEIVAHLKCSNFFCDSLKMRLIKCEIKLVLQKQKVAFFLQVILKH